MTHPLWNHPEFAVPLDVRIVELGTLRHHEEFDHDHLRKLRKEIESNGILTFAIVVDRNTNIILDGEHRFNALKQLGCSRIPVVFVDYYSPAIEVQAWRIGEHVTKKDVIEAGLGEKKFPPVTSRHVIRTGNIQAHISLIEKRVDISLEKLRDEPSDRR